MKTESSAPADDTSEWNRLRAEYRGLERTFDERTRGLSAEERSIIWAPADAFADQAGMDKLKGDLRRACSSLSWAVEHAGRILAQLTV
ncbi:MAG: hypothetical protein R3C24_07965 [Cyanobacteriota/Melainabacteria group bacterium]